jgi:hypothetical protein
MIKKNKRNCFSLKLSNQQRSIMLEALQDCIVMSGGSIKKFCDENNITTQTYYDWKKRHIPLLRAINLSRKYGVDIERLCPFIH